MTRRAIKDRTGERYGRLVVTGLARRAERGGNHLFETLCDCGVISEKWYCNLRSGASSSCGCLRSEVTTRINTKHGMVASPTYRSWQDMRKRCENDRAKRYADYGGRGISVCARWARFENFLADMGERPKGKTLDRIDVNGDYEPDNCRWADSKTQARNKRNNVRLAAKGQIKTIAEWAEVSPVTQPTITNRLQAGWDIEDAIFAQPGAFYGGKPKKAAGG